MVEPATSLLFPDPDTGQKSCPETSLLTVCMPEVSLAHVQPSSSEMPDPALSS
jgi:hypothetical protein